MLPRQLQLLSLLLLLGSCAEQTSQPQPDGQAARDGALPDIAKPKPDLPPIKPDLPPIKPDLPPIKPDLGCTSPAQCDDGDGCNGVERCVAGKCLPALARTCPRAPSECKQSGGSPAPVSGVLTSVSDPGGFRLKDQNRWSAQAAIIAKIAAHSSATAVTLDTVLGDLNRSGSTVSSVSGVQCFNNGFKWNSGDSAVTYWYPQGTAGTATAYAGGAYKGKKVLMVSWYHKPAKDPSTNLNKGARVSIADLTKMTSAKTVKYRLALLVEPVLSGGLATFKPVPVHAGGMAWRGNLLYVADTSKGFRVFDLTKILKVQTGDKTLVGYSASKKAYHAASYKYVIPQVNSYTLCPGSCCARFSFCALDTGASLLVAGEYSSSSANSGRLHRWPMDLVTGKLVAKSGAVTAHSVMLPGVRKMQGGVTVGARVWISSSQPKSSSPSSPGSLYSAAKPGQKIATYRYPYPPEDLHHAPGSANLWCHTENPGKRYVYSVKPAKLLTGCK